jgi:hypothetical protein
MAYTGTLNLEVGDLDAALGKAQALAVQQSGYVEHENSVGGANAQLVLRVPSASFAATLDQLAALGTVLGRSSQADDLTQQVVDTDSRVKSQQASVDRVRALMGEAKSLTEVLALESELSKREADLESLQRQQQQLASRTSLSTVTLELVQHRATGAAPAAPARPGFWGSIGHALAGGWHVLLAVLRGVLIGLAAVAPFLLLLSPLAWPVRRYLKRRRAAHPAAPEPAAEPEPTP